MCSLPGFYAPKADLTAPKSDFRFTPESGSVSCQQRKSPTYSVTSSARASSVGGISMPSAFADLRLIARVELRRLFRWANRSASHP